MLTNCLKRKIMHAVRTRVSTLVVDDTDDTIDNEPVFLVLRVWLFRLIVNIEWHHSSLGWIWKEYAQTAELHTGVVLNGVDTSDDTGKSS